ncbi:MAG TPA: hypothetical protein P5049_03890 [Methanothrix sp.]|nr:hypothetical protein [Methanothrix sp.]
MRATRGDLERKARIDERNRQRRQEARARLPATSSRGFCNPATLARAPL